MKKEVRFEVRLTELQRDRFAKAADLANMSFSAWVRSRLKRAAYRELELGGKEPVSKIRERRSWVSMINRCADKSNHNFKYYGARGIGVCSRWANSFELFYQDMGPRPRGTSLDRKDNDKGYEPGNCRWATRFEQQQNTRATRKITLNGVTMGITAWARKLGIDHASLIGRLNRGWSIERALKTPAKKMKV